MSTTYSMSGSSDDCHYVTKDGVRTDNGEYNEPRLRIQLPDGQEIVAHLQYGDGWETQITIPDGYEVISEELSYDKGWVPFGADIEDEDGD